MVVVNPNKTVTVDQLIRLSGSLAEDFGVPAVNPEYNRALVELVFNAAGCPMEDRAEIETLIGEASDKTHRDGYPIHDITGKNPLLYRRLVTKWDVFMALTTNGNALVEVQDGERKVRGTLMRVERGDGSGSCFSLAIRENPASGGAGLTNVFLRTAD